MIETTDVVVVGGGGAGLAAAISAATSGAEVLLLEKQHQAGGSTAMSVGSFSAANTSYQYRAGVNDSIDQFVDDMRAANGETEERENQSLRRLLAENAGPTLEWLSSLGVQFLGPTPEPPFVQPRMHNVVPNSAAYVSALLREARRRDVRVVTGVRVEALLRNRSGAVIGARAGDRTYLARRGVLLATGDYSASPELKTEFAGAAASKVPPINPGSTGDGFKLGTDVGGTLVQMDRLFEGLRFAPSRLPDAIKVLPSQPALSRLMRAVAERFPRVFTFVARAALTSWMAPAGTLYDAGAIVVDTTGRRVANENSDKDLARGIASGSNTAYVLFDADVAETFSQWPHPISTFPGVAYAYLKDYRRYRPDLYFAAKSLPELARKIGVDPTNLEGTVDAWNEDATRGSDRLFGRPRLGHGLRRSPFYALGPVGAYVTLTDGGLMVDDALRVVDREGVPVPGLWAAGSTGQGGLQLVNHGLHIAWAMVSGRLAGRNIAHAEMRQDLSVTGTSDSVLGRPVVTTPEEKR